MKKSTIFSVFVALFTGIGGFFLGRSMPNPSSEVLVPREDPEIVVLNTDEVPEEPASTPLDSAITEPEPSPAAPVIPQPVEPEPEPTQPEKPDPVVINTGEKSSAFVLDRINTGISDKKISKELTVISEKMEKQNLEYVSSLGQDCSGIYHKIKDQLQERIPALGHATDYTYPTYNHDRSSRQIADWYWKHENLLIVEDPIASRNSIRPGSVMFFGQSGKSFSNMTIEQLTDKENKYTSNGFIMHVAVVTEVKRDEDNNVIEYTMMHGRNPRVFASRTGSKEIQSTRTPGLPAFGHWTQQWVAVANIMTPTGAN